MPVSAIVIQKPFGSFITYEPAYYSLHAGQVNRQTGTDNKAWGLMEGQTWPARETPAGAGDRGHG